ncbi:hypothetical protein PP182_05715 [Maribacter sp. PR1]|uniref:Beta-lactamase-inhibitor-like PepSY-like domain-containing protein n=1 Tax=Maribacter cobaltidurans TaxID=1178778 RepID=A0ABU7IRQ0_9FLAO|nr:MULTISPECIES: hypothetical protein [Maribacter]MDC6388167.1 hypothetical protein [Maribacter sp. PR1]MEE1975555.1 hypothetical protein [Maribacter cobaltidurans]
MKRLVLLGALAIASLPVMAQDADLAQADATEMVAVADEFTEIETSELPEAVTNAVSTNYPTATINKAYVNEEKQYKLEVALEDGTAGTLYADKEGNWLDM